MLQYVGEVKSISSDLARSDSLKILAGGEAGAAKGEAPAMHDGTTLRRNDCMMLRQTG